MQGRIIFSTMKWVNFFHSWPLFRIVSQQVCCEWGKIFTPGSTFSWSPRRHANEKIFFNTKIEFSVVIDKIWFVSFDLSEIGVQCYSKKIVGKETEIVLIRCSTDPVPLKSFNTVEFWFAEEFLTFLCGNIDAHR